jgi:hypothetical protein
MVVLSFVCLGALGFSILLVIGDYIARKLEE